MAAPTEPPPPPAARPAAEELRSLRRWLVLLGVIAVLAAAAAAFALVKWNESENEAADEDRLALVERQIDRRLEALDNRLARTSAEIDNQERRLRRTGEEADVVNLDRRLRRVENDVTDAVEAAADAGEGLRGIERRLRALSRDVRRLE